MSSDFSMDSILRELNRAQFGVHQELMSMFIVKVVRLQAYPAPVSCRRNRHCGFGPNRLTAHATYQHLIH